jgi:hypothetical protein
MIEFNHFENDEQRQITPRIRLLQNLGDLLYNDDNIAGSRRICRFVLSRIIRRNHRVR